MNQIAELLKQDLEGEPEAGRGVPLREPVDFGMKPEEPKEPEEVTEEPAETQEEDAEGQEKPSEGEAQEETHAEGQKLRAKEFADQAGWSLEEFYRDVTVPTDEGEVTLSEVVDGYKSLRSENESLRNERQTLEAKATQAPMQQYAPEAVELVKEAQLLQRQYDAIQQDGTLDNMEAGESLKLDRKYRYEIDRRIKAAQEKQTEHSQKVEGEMREYMGKVETQLRRDIPEWRSEKIRTEEAEAIAGYLRSEGAEQQAIDQILKFNPWATRMFRKLWQFEKTQAANKKAVKEVKKVPKSLSPSARQTETRKPNLREAGKYVNEAKSRRERDKRLFEVDIDDALLPK